jgi:hypothetical protein
MSCPGDKSRGKRGVYVPVRGPSVAPSDSESSPGLALCLLCPLCLSVYLSVTATPRQGYYSCDPRTLLFLSSLNFSRRRPAEFSSIPFITSDSFTLRDVYYAMRTAGGQLHANECIVRHGPHVFVKFCPSYYVPPPSTNNFTVFHFFPFFRSFLVIAPLASPTLVMLTP